MLGAFLLLAVVPLAAVGVLIDRQGDAMLSRALQERLSAVALLKSQQIEGWVKGRQIDVARPASLTTFRKLLSAALVQPRGPEGDAAEREFREILERLRTSGEFVEVFVLDPHRGTVLVSTDRLQEGKFKRDRPYFRGGRRGLFVQHVYYSMVLGKPTMAFSAPVKEPGGTLLAILVGRVDLRFLDRLMGERAGLGGTGQTFLVNRFNYFVSDSLGSGEGGWRPVFSEGVTRALAGETGTGGYVNHAGHRVVAAYRWIPGLGLGLIAEMHELEALAPLRAFRLALVGVLGVVAILAVLTGAGVFYGVARPVTRLVEAARAIGEGRLDHRVDIETPAELATLGQAFNSMAARLEGLQATLERRVDERTAELATLQRLADATAEAETPEGLLSQALDLIVEFLEAEAGLALVADAETDRLILAAHRGLPDAVAASLREHPVRLDSAPHGDGLAARLRLGDLPVRSVITLRVTARGRLLGMLVLARFRSEGFAAEQVTFLEVLGSQLGAVAESLRLQRCATGRSRELETLATVTGQLTRLQHADQLLHLVVTEAERLLGAEGVGIRKLEGNDLVLVACTETAREVMRTVRIKVGESLSGLVASENRVIAVHDLSSDDRQLPEHKRGALAAGVRSFLGVPLRLENRLIGVLSLWTKRQRRFSDDETQIVFTFANQAAIAIENARLYQDLATKNSHLEHLFETARQAAVSLSLSEILGSLARAAAGLASHDAASIRLLDPSGTLLLAAAHHGLSEEFANRGPLAVGQGLTGGVIVDGRPVTVEDLAQATGYVHREHARAEGVCAMAIVPLRSRDRNIGALAVYARAPRRYTPDEVALLSQFANLAAVSIEKARLYAAVETRAARIRRLTELSQLVNSSLDVQRVFDFVTEAAVDLLSGDRAGAWVLDEEAGTIRLVTESPREDRGVPRLLRELQRGEGLVGWAIEHRAKRYSPDVREDPLFVDREWAAAAGHVSMIVVPLLVGERAIGAVTLMTRAPRRFDAEDEELLELFAATAATAVENARLFERARDHAEHLTALTALMRLVLSAADTREVYDAVARVATTLLDARIARVWVDDPAARLFRVVGAHSADPALLAVAAASETIPHGEGLVGEIGRSPSAVYVTDILADPRVFYQALWRKVGARAMAVVPLVAGTAVVGALSVVFGARQPFTDEEKHLMQLLADQAAIVIQKARLSDEMQRTLEELEAKNAELDAFVYSVSHDLKAPLVAVQGMAGALLEDCADQLDEHGQHYVNRLQANVEQMERLIRDLLTLSRVGREGRGAGPVDLAEVVGDVLAELGEPIRARGIKVTVGDLPELWGLRVQIEQLMRNLVGNAVKYIGDAATPTIEIGATRHADAWECRVRDNGIGIEPAYHEKVFEIFQRLGEVEVEGTGVGLALVKKIVDLAGGRAWVESAKGEGATFRFTWPLEPVSAASSHA
ncbi:MAG: GAF domain-containing protein [Candidatus Rokubacteria bacterium]|nr:GAF domain-containing protein [Candidatus Rokubacteria bacterium]